MTAVLSRFLAKRVFVWAAVGALFAFFIFERKAVAPLGVLLGCVTALYKVKLQELLLNAVAQNETMAVKFRVFAIISPFLALGLLVVGILVDIQLFAGLTIGFLSLPVFIMINALTERLGLTKNRWGGSVED